MPSFPKRWTELRDPRSRRRGAYVESWLPEVFGIVGALGATVIAVVWGAINGDDAESAIGGAIVPALLTFIIAEFIADRAAQRTRSGRLERIEHVLQSPEFFDHVSFVGERYREAQNQMRHSRHPKLFGEVLDRLLTAKDWDNIAESRLEFGEERELQVTIGLLDTVSSTIDAVAYDIEFHQSPQGRGYLFLQALMARKPAVDPGQWKEYLKRVFGDDLALTGESLDRWCDSWEIGPATKGTHGVIVRRIMAWDAAQRYAEYLITCDDIERDAEPFEDYVDSVRKKFQDEAAFQSSVGILCRSIDVTGEDDVPDLNIYDGESVRYSTLLLDDNRMHVIVSESETDLISHHALYQTLFYKSSLPDPNVVEAISTRHNKPSELRGSRRVPFAIRRKLGPKDSSARPTDLDVAEESSLREQGADSE